MYRVLIARMNADPASTDEFNTWYDGEHMAQASGIPGYGTNHRRYRAEDLAGSSWPYRPHPEYTAMYEVRPEADLLEAINSDQYRAWSGDFLARWRDRTSNEVSVMSEQLSGQDAPVSSSAVIIAQLNVPPGTEDEFVRWHTEEHVPQASKVPGLGTDHRLFRSLELEGKYWHYQPNPQFTAVYEVSSDTDFRSLVDSPEFQGWAQEFASRGTATEDYELLTACRRIY